MESESLNPKPAFLTLYSYTQQPGFDSRRHSHRDFWEMLLITGGSLRVVTRDESSEAVAGSIYIRPPGIPHQESCVVDTPVTLWVMSWIVPRMGRLPEPMKAFDSTRQIEGGINWLAYLQRALGPRHAMLDSMVETLLFSCSLGVQPGEKNRFSPVLDHIQDNLAGSHSLAKLARVACMSESHFSHEFHRQTGLSPMAYVRKVRVEHACKEVIQTTRLFREIAREIGFRDEFEFSRVFRRIMGVSPNKLRRQPDLEKVPAGTKSTPRRATPALRRKRASR